MATVYSQIFKWNNSGLPCLAFQMEVLQNGLRKKSVQMVKTLAKGDFDVAVLLTEEYLIQVRQESDNAEEAIEIVKQILYGQAEENVYFFKCREGFYREHITKEELPMSNE